MSLDEKQLDWNAESGSTLEMTVVNAQRTRVDSKPKGDEGDVSLDPRQVSFRVLDE